MLRRAAFVGVAMALSLAIPAAAQQQERTVATRNFDRFELDSDSVTGFWAEAGSLFQRTNKNHITDTSIGTFAYPGLYSGPIGTKLISGADKKDVDVTTTFARFAYGGDKWEGNLFVPYRQLNGEFRSGGNVTDIDENGIGDIQLAAKYVPVRSGLLDLGVGALLSLPSGDDNRRLGGGAFGGAPFITGAMHFALLDIHAHLAPEFFAGWHTNGQASDRFLYGFDFLVPLCKYAALRNEFSAVDNYDLNNSPKTMSYLPGLDIRVPIGDMDLLLRPTGSVGLTNDSPTWGFGGSIAITSPTMRAAAAKTVGGVVVE